MCRSADGAKIPNKNQWQTHNQWLWGPSNILPAGMTLIVDSLTFFSLNLVSESGGERAYLDELLVVSENCLAVWRVVRQGLVLAVSRPLVCVLCCRVAAAGDCRCLQEADQGHQAGQAGSSLSPLSRHPGRGAQLSLGAELCLHWAGALSQGAPAYFSAASLSAIVNIRVSLYYHSNCFYCSRENILK